MGSFMVLFAQNYFFFSAKILCTRTKLKSGLFYSIYSVNSIDNLCFQEISHVPMLDQSTTHGTMHNRCTIPTRVSSAGPPTSKLPANVRCLECAARHQVQTHLY